MDRKCRRVTLAVPSPFMPGKTAQKWLNVPPMSRCLLFAICSQRSGLAAGLEKRPESDELGIFGRSGPADSRPFSKEALAGARLAWSDQERLEARLQDRSLSFEERQRLKDMKHWRMTRPRAQLPPERYEQVANLALEYSENRIRVEELARDPDHRGAITDNSIQEAHIALTMEREGRLREVIRDPRVGCGDLIERDGAGQEWDVYSPLGVDFDLEQVEGELSEKLMNQQQGDRMMKVIVNCAHLSREQVGEVEKIVDVAGWTDLVRYGTSQSRR